MLGLNLLMLNLTHSVSVRCVRIDEEWRRGLESGDSLLLDLSIDEVWEKETVNDREAY